MRLDKYILEQGLCVSRSAAQDAIKAARVKVNDRIITKSAFEVKEEDVVIVEKNDQEFASRGAHKLYGALIDFRIDLKDRIVADIGASTGGFTDVCLSLGAKKVYALDVGCDQLIERLKQDKRVVNMEKTNCRYLHKEQFDELPDFACADVSFISLKQIIPSVYALLAGDKEMVLLVKPQFEAGKHDVGKHGIVKKGAVHVRVLKEMEIFLTSLGLYLHHCAPSAIAGRDGNQEYIMHVSTKAIQRSFDFRKIVSGI